LSRLFLLFYFLHNLRNNSRIIRTYILDTFVDNSVGEFQLNHAHIQLCIVANDTTSTKTFSKPHQDNRLLC
uniref:Secreted protein n=1 Tax=Hymenolepis diminuta TaxID=6216 RepID=A0A0R3SFA2_HYMDI